MATAQARKANAQARKDKIGEAISNKETYEGMKDGRDDLLNLAAGAELEDVEELMNDQKEAIDGISAVTDLLTQQPEYDADATDEVALELGIMPPSIMEQQQGMQKQVHQQANQQQLQQMQMQMQQQFYQQQMMQQQMMMMGGGMVPQMGGGMMPQQPMMAGMGGMQQPMMAGMGGMQQQPMMWGAQQPMMGVQQPTQL